MGKIQEYLKDINNKSTYILIMEVQTNNRIIERYCKEIEKTTNSYNLLIDDETIKTYLIKIKEYININNDILNVIKTRMGDICSNQISP